MPNYKFSVASTYSINKSKKKIMTDYCNPVHIQIASGKEIEVYRFDGVFTMLIQSLGAFTLPSNLTVVFNGDSGMTSFNLYFAN